MSRKTGSLVLCALGTLAWAATTGFGDERVRTIGAVIDDFHDAAAQADGPRYFGHMTKDAVFLGTDATERWPRAAFEAFAKPYFDKGRGWAYTSRNRSVDVEAGGDLAWFDELLHNEHYGTCRGSGVLRREDGRWRIAQYNLSIPIPNPLAKAFVARIRAHDESTPVARVVYVVRHAEKAAGDTDPELTEAGHERARHLARVLRSAGIGTIYATEYKRTQQTVAPTAQACGVAARRYAASETRQLAETLAKATDMRAVLVAGHSNTIPDLLKHLGLRSDVTIDDGDYDNLFVVTLVRGDDSRFQWLHFGE